MPLSIWRGSKNRSLTLKVDSSSNIRLWQKYWTWHSWAYDCYATFCPKYIQHISIGWSNWNRRTKLDLLPMRCVWPSITLLYDQYEQRWISYRRWLPIAVKINEKELHMIRRGHPELILLIFLLNKKHNCSDVNASCDDVHIGFPSHKSGLAKLWIVKLAQNAYLIHLLILWRWKLISFCHPFV